MAEKAIVLSAFEVQAVLDNRKTQTRRVVKPQPSSDYIQLPRIDALRYFLGKSASIIDQLNSVQIIPKYQPGDTLWAQETWGFDAGGDDYGTGYFVYRADGKEKPSYLRWCSPATMPREAARIFLRLTDVRVERIQDITASGCIDEGITIEWTDELPKPSFMSLAYSETRVKPAFINEYRKLWDTLNAKRGFGWDVNPWVWVYTFERLEAQK